MRRIKEEMPTDPQRTLEVLVSEFLLRLDQLLCSWRSRHATEQVPIDRSMVRAGLRSHTRTLDGSAILQVQRPRGSVNTGTASPLNSGCSRGTRSASGSFPGCISERLQAGDSSNPTMSENR